MPNIGIDHAAAGSPVAVPKNFRLQSTQLDAAPSRCARRCKSGMPSGSCSGSSSRVRRVLSGPVTGRNRYWNNSSPRHSAQLISRSGVPSLICTSPGPLIQKLIRGSTKRNEANLGISHNSAQSGSATMEISRPGQSLAHHLHVLARRSPRADRSGLQKVRGLVSERHEDSGAELHSLHEVDRYGCEIIAGRVKVFSRPKTAEG